MLIVALKLKLLNDKKGACLDYSKAGELGYEQAYDFIKEYCNEWRIVYSLEKILDGLKMINEKSQLKNDVKN